MYYEQKEVQEAEGQDLFVLDGLSVSCERNVLKLTRYLVLFCSICLFLCPVSSIAKQCQEKEKRVSFEEIKKKFPGDLYEHETEFIEVWQEWLWFAEGCTCSFKLSRQDVTPIGSTVIMTAHKVKLKCKCRMSDGNIVATEKELVFLVISKWMYFWEGTKIREGEWQPAKREIIHIEDEKTKQPPKKGIEI